MGSIITSDKKIIEITAYKCPNCGHISETEFQICENCNMLFMEISGSTELNI